MKLNQLIFLFVSAISSMFPAWAESPDRVDPNARPAESPSPLSAYQSKLQQLLSQQPALASQEYQRIVAQLPAPARLAAQVDWCWLLAPSQPKAAIALTLPDSSQQILQLRLQLCQAYALEQSGDNQAALSQYQALATEPLLRDYPQSYQRLLTLRGEQFAAFGLYPEALADLQQAYQLAIDQQGSLSYLRNALANIYAEPAIGDYAEAIALYQQLLAEHQQNNAQKEMATALFNLGSSWQKAGDLQKTLLYLQQALALDLQLKLPDDVAWDQRSLALLYNKLQQPQQALALIEPAYQHYLQRGDAQSARYCLLTRAATLAQLRRDAEAERDFRQLQADAETLQDPRLAAALYRDFAALQAQRGLYQEAFQLSRQQAELELEMQRNGAQQRVSVLKASLQTEQIRADKEQLALQNQLQAQQIAQAARTKFWQWLALGFALALLVVLSLSLYRQRLQAQRLRCLAEQDELTRLPNRRHALELARLAFMQHQRNQQPLAVLAVDIDWFKRINDQYGHQAGDLVLQKVAHQLRLSLRPQDKVGRVGGEEFLLLLPQTALAEAADVAERVRAAVAQLQLAELPGPVTISVGLAVLSGVQDNDFAALWQRADLALYQAKAQGRNCVMQALAEASV